MVSLGVFSPAVPSAWPNWPVVGNRCSGSTDIARVTARPRRHRDVDHAHLADQLRVIAQQAFIREHPPRDALRVIQPIDAQQDPLFDQAVLKSSLLLKD